MSDIMLFTRLKGEFVMDIITAEQAAEAAKGLTFEKVWAVLMEDRLRMQESQKQMQESQKQMQESYDKTQKQMQESYDKTQRQIDELSKNIGGVGNTLGRLSESMFAVELYKKFNEIGYPFTKQGPHVKFHENGRVVAEADYLLENGDYVMVVEVKTESKIEDVNDHMQRISAIRSYFDAHGDSRTLVGAVACVMLPENVKNYAQKQGLYVITQSGDSITIADYPKGFKAREW